MCLDIREKVGFKSWSHLTKSLVVVIESVMIKLLQRSRISVSKPIIQNAIHDQRIASTRKK